VENSLKHVVTVVWLSCIAKPTYPVIEVLIVASLLWLLLSVLLPLLLLFTYIMVAAETRFAKPRSPSPPLSCTTA
jgi:hypothetical protein